MAPSCAGAARVLWLGSRTDGKDLAAAAATAVATATHTNHEMEIA